MLNMFQTLIHPSSAACDFSIASQHWSRVVVVVVSTHDQCCDAIEKSQARDDGCVNVRNMLNIEEVK